MSDYFHRDFSFKSIVFKVPIKSGSELHVCYSFTYRVSLLFRIRSVYIARSGRDNRNSRIFLMSSTCYNWEKDKELKRLEMKYCYTQKETSLDFQSAALFPDWWQILLESIRTRLFDPISAVNIAEIMMDSPDRDVSLLGHSAITQIAILHPHLVKPLEVVKLPLFDARIVTDLIAKDSKNYTNYANNRLLLLGLTRSDIDPIKYTIERNLLQPFISSRYEAVFDALVCNDTDALETCRDNILSNPDHRLFFYWWEIFFERYLYHQ